MAASLAAIMVSTDSSPTFSRILFKPLWYRLATYELSAAAPLRASSTSARRASVSVMRVSCLINGVRVFENRVDDLPASIIIDPIETALASGVTGDPADLFDHQDNNVSVA